MEPPPPIAPPQPGSPYYSRQASDASSSSGTPSSTSTSSPIPLAPAAPPGLSSAAALAAALTRALPPFFQHLACHEIPSAIKGLLALKGGVPEGGEALSVLDNVLSPFLLLAAAERMHHAPTTLVESCQGPLPMYQEVTRDINMLLQLFSRATPASADPALDRLRWMLAAALAALRLRVVLCRWFLAQAQRPAQPRPEEQEVLLRLLMLHEMAQHGPMGGQSPPTLARLASGGSGVSGSSPASPGGLPPAPSPQFLPSPRAASAATVLLDTQEAAEVVEEELEALAERLADCCGGEGQEEEGAGGLRAWAETVAVEAQALLSGLHATEALNARPALLPSITALLRFRRALRLLERLHLLMHLDPCLLPDEDEGTGDEAQHSSEAGHLSIPRLRALRRWLDHLVAKLPLRLHAAGPTAMGPSVYQHRLLGLPLNAKATGAAGSSSAAAYVRLVARFLAHYGPTPAVCAAVVMRGACQRAGYTLPGGREEEEAAILGGFEYAPVFCMTAIEALTGSSAPPAPAAPTAPAVSSSSLSVLDASTHSVLSTSSHNYHIHRQQPASIAGGNSLDVSLSGGYGMGGGGAMQHAQQAAAAAAGGGAAAATKAATGAPPPYWADFWRSGIEPALQGLPEGGDRYLLLPKEEGEEEVDATEEDETVPPLGASPLLAVGGGLRSLFLPPSLFRRRTYDDHGGAAAAASSFWARAKSPGRAPRTIASGGGEPPPSQPPPLQMQRIRSSSRTPDRRQRPPAPQRRRRTIVPLPPLPEAEAAAALAGTFVHQNGARWRAGSSNVVQPQFAYYVAPISGAEALVVLFADRSRPAADGHVVGFIRAMVAVLADRGVFASA